MRFMLQFGERRRSSYGTGRANLRGEIWQARERGSPPRAVPREIDS